jgi:hypothetical protein
MNPELEPFHARKNKNTNKYRLAETNFWSTQSTGKIYGKNRLEFLSAKPVGGFGLRCTTPTPGNR